MHLPVALAAVSDAAAAVLGSQFGRAPVLLPNGVDGARFAPGPRSARPPDAVVEPDPGEQRSGARAQCKAESYACYGSKAVEP